MAFSTSKSYKAFKISPPPRPNVILQSCKQPSLVRQVSDEDLESNESSSKYFKSKLESRNHMLHHNERRPCPHHVLSPKQSKQVLFGSTRHLLGLIGLALAFNLMRVIYYPYPTKKEHVYIVSHDTKLSNKQTPGHKLRMVYLGDNYNLLGASPYLHQKPKNRNILDPFPAEQTDVTQLYSTANSNDIRLGTMERKFFPEHETDKKCVPMSEWQFMSFPTCNLFHEMEMTDHNMLASGNWRDTWLQQNNGDKTIVKTLKFEHTFQEQYYELSRVDALAMEQLTSNPFVMDVHGFCGVSVMTARGHHELGFVVGKLQPRDKVIVSIQVALSIAAVHEIDGIGKPASLVHNDININNIFWGERGPLLNDFNIAVLMMKDKETNRICKFPLHYPNPQWKSPEEQLSADGTSPKHLDEKVDVYALGNLLFRFATGTGPWREYAGAADVSLTPEQKDKIAYMKLFERATPSIPKETLESKDRYIKTIVEAMKMCYRYNPKERPTARGVARFLQMSLDEIDAESK